jgi:ribosome biogenesis GTPase
MYDLSFDAKIIDTPGIKGFGIVIWKKEEISGYFLNFKLKSSVNSIIAYKDEPMCCERSVGKR